MTQTFTYYQPDAAPETSSGWREGHGRGKAWVRGTYTPPDYPSPLNVRVGDAGIKVWMVMRWLKELNNDSKRVIGVYDSVLTPEDIEAARRFYADHAEEIDARIEQELEPA